MSNYLDALNGKCIIHFAAWDTLRDCTAFYCDAEFPVANWRDYYGPFKRAFTFEPYTYCFHCGTPNDKQCDNYFQPAAHMNISPSNCAWKHLCTWRRVCVHGRLGVRAGGAHERRRRNKKEKVYEKLLAIGDVKEHKTYIKLTIDRPTAVPMNPRCFEEVGA